MSREFEWEMRVRFADTDTQGHVYFANYLTFCDEAMSAYLRAIACPWRAILDEGIDTFYVNSNCDYKGSARFEDVIRIAVRVERIGRTSMVFGYTIRDQESNVLAEASLTTVFIETATRRPTPVPALLKDAIARFDAID